MFSHSTPSGKKPRVYLSGGMEYADNEGRDWRAALQDWLEHTMNCIVFNPNVESDRFLLAARPGGDFRSLKASDPAAYKAIVSQLVHLDCEEIAHRSDIVICYWDASAQRGAGTKGELTIAKYFGKPVYMVTSSPTDQIPGWVLGCTTQIFPSFPELKVYLQRTGRSGPALQ